MSISITYILPRDAYQASECMRSDAVRYRIVDAVDTALRATSHDLIPDSARLHCSVARPHELVRDSLVVDGLDDRAVDKIRDVIAAAEEAEIRRALTADELREVLKDMGASSSALDEIDLVDAATDIATDDDIRDLLSLCHEIDAVASVRAARVVTP